MRALTRLSRVLTSHGPQTTVRHLEYQAQADLLSDIHELQVEQAVVLAQVMDWLAAVSIELAAVSGQLQRKKERSRSARYVLSRVRCAWSLTLTGCLMPSAMARGQ